MKTVRYSIYFLILSSLCNPLFAGKSQENKVVRSAPFIVLEKALSALMTGNIEALLNLTEKKELAETKSLLKAMEDPLQKDKILNTHKNLKSWVVVEESQEKMNDRHLAVITVCWEMHSKKISAPNGNSLETKSRYVHYLLEKFGDNWKIVSRKVVPSVR